MFAFQTKLSKQIQENVRKEFAKMKEMLKKAQEAAKKAKSNPNQKNKTVLVI